MSVQVLQGVLRQATRASRADAIPHEFAAGLIEAWSHFAFRMIRKAYGFSYWDSAIVAGVLTLGCDRLYTEHLNHGQVVEGLAIMDPLFR